LTEICNAALHLIKAPRARIETLMDHIKGPDFPTGGIIVEPHANMLEAYATGRGGFKVRARWFKEDVGRGQWQVAIESKKIPWLADVRDESAEDVRIVLEPKSKNIEASTRRLAKTFTSEIG